MRNRLPLMPAVLLGVMLGGIAACRSPRPLASLGHADTAARLGMYDAAHAEYKLAQTQCQALDAKRRRASTCRAAFLGPGYVYLQQGDAAAAEAVFAAQTTHMLIDDLGMSEAAFRAGQLALARGAHAAAADYFWYAIRQLPQAPFSGEALRTVVAQTRQQAPAALVAQLLADHAARPNSALADDMLWWAGDVAKELGDMAQALACWDALATDYHNSPWRNDAMWFAATLVAERAEADPTRYDELITRLQAIGKTRRVARLTGSFITIYLDDAQLLLGQTLRKLGRPREAIDAFAQLPRLYPDSLLRDDALYELATTYAAQGQTTGACEAMASLAIDFPRSKYLMAGRARPACAEALSGGKE